MLNIQKTMDVSNNYLNIFIWGDPGGGKTTFSGTVEYKAKTLILSAESGLLSLRNLDGANIDYVTIDRFEKLEEVFHYLKNDKHPYQAVAMDSITEIQKVCMDKILEDEKIDKARIQDWGTLNSKMERLIRAFRDLPMHFIATGLAESEVDKTTGEVRIVPLLQGKFQKSIAAYFDEVFYAYTKQVGDEIKYFILTKNSGKVTAKDRSGKLPQVIESPTFTKVYDLIFNQQTKGDK